MKVTREISVYEKDGDKYLNSCQINLSLEKMIDILNIDLEKDPEVYDVYKINLKQYIYLKEFIPELLVLNFNKVEIFYECHQE
jgi:hypothetical protein